MRRRVGSFALLGILAIASGGCPDFRSLFSAHAGAVAEVGGYQLSAERLSKILTSARGAQPSRDAAEYVTQLWVDHALFAQAAANGKLPTDSAGIAEAVWSEIAEMKSRRWHDTLVARRHPVDPAKADSAYAANNVRVLQHILFRVPATAPDSAKATARKKAEKALADIKGGANFSALAAKLSEDPGSKIDSGYLPPSPKGKFVPAFDSAGWALAPGAVSGLVQTPFGYHIIKRPAREVVRARLIKYLSTSTGYRADSLYMDSVATTNKLTVSTGAPAAIRAALNDPYGSRHSTTVIASYKGGNLTVADFAHWMQALPPQYAMQLKQVPDSMLTRFARILTQNVLLIRSADSAGIKLTPDEWSHMLAQQRGEIDSLRSAMGLTSPEFTDSSLSADRRTKLAMLKLDQYFDELVSGRKRLRPIPTAFAGLLRDRGTYRIYSSGINRAVELARAEQAADSTRNGGMPATPPAFRRAPGPPPVPGVQGAKAPTPAPAPVPAPAAPKDTGKGH